MMTKRTTAGAIYAARRANRITALPAERSRDFCATECYAKGDLSICDGATACWAKSIGASSRAATASDIYAKRQLEVERGRTPAPRPRSIHDVIRDHYRSRA